MVTFPPHFLLSCVPGGKEHRGTRAEPRALKLKEQNHSLSCISDLYFLPLICDLQHFPQHSLCRRTAHVFFFLFLFLCRLFSKESHTQSSLLSRLTFLFLLCYDFFFQIVLGMSFLISLTSRGKESMTQHTDAIKLSLSCIRVRSFIFLASAFRLLSMNAPFKMRSQPFCFLCVI